MRNPLGEVLVGFAVLLGLPAILYAIVMLYHPAPPRAQPAGISYSDPAHALDPP